MIIKVANIKIGEYISGENINSKTLNVWACSIYEFNPAPIVFIIKKLGIKPKKLAKK